MRRGTWQRISARVKNRNPTVPCWLSLLSAALVTKLGAGEPSPLQPSIPPPPIALLLLIHLSPALLYTISCHTCVCSTLSCWCIVSPHVAQSNTSSRRCGSPESINYFHAKEAHLVQAPNRTYLVTSSSDNHVE